VIVGAPHFFSSTTLRPRGPRVTLTASASVLRPRSRPRRASSSNAMIFDISVLRPFRTSGTLMNWHSASASARAIVALDRGECKPPGHTARALAAGIRNDERRHLTGAAVHDRWLQRSHGFRLRPLRPLADLELHGLALFEDLVA